MSSQTTSQRQAPGPQNAPAKPRVQSAMRTVSILTAIAGSDQGLRARDIIEQLGLPRQVAYHLLHTLVSTGIIRRNDRNRYVLGLGAAAIADGFRRQFAPPEHLAPMVRRVASETGETAYAAGWRDGEIVNLASAPGSNAIQAMSVPQGYSRHAHARATGKLLLAFASDSVKDAYLASHELARLTPRTLTERPDLDAALREIRDRGYAMDQEEFTDGLCCLAVPVGGTNAAFALGLSAPRERFDENLDMFLTVMRSLAEAG